MTSDNTATLTAREAFLKKSAEQIRRLGRRAAQDVVEIGKLLTECKAKLGHGEFLPWIEREFGWSERTARYFMSVHQMDKSAKIADLNIDPTALYTLAAKKMPNSVREQILERARQGEHISQRTLDVTVTSPPSRTRTTIVPIYDTSTPTKPADPPPFTPTISTSDQSRADLIDATYKADALRRAKVKKDADHIMELDRNDAGYAQELVDAVIERMRALRSTH